ncbi:enoyl-CoA hydratase/isomerase family protein [Billgrantia kenyensis]|uniref:Enoyl-CoA hydratase n=1 Tax=Billgrantia kenyensis TaxID=321266 RepID=A0A7V9W195_9GAMM|nr:enoyl-CoA hydratase/isomerase family protein [Halomonas kenyensis]MBA2779127.1 enoyl-CoA hydratase/isomerase family protein [Halomonas kenyensis]MCG6660554.1 enoyl-CoA hydratase [Halomonas kenyensis]
MSVNTLLYEVRDGVAWLGFNRPESRNAMTWEMYDALSAHCDHIREDDAVHAVVLHGVGGEAFVAGTDIGQFESFRTPGDAVGYEQRIDAVVGKLEALPKPTIALLEGACVGGGAALALVCDFRYATPSLKFGVPIARTLGNTLSISNVARMIDMLGVARTKEALMLGTLFDAEQASGAGLLNGVIEPKTIYAEVAAVAEQLGRRAPLTLQASKALVGRVLAHRRLARDASDDWVTTCYMSDDFKAAVNKFLHKTPFEWSGR